MTSRTSQDPAEHLFGLVRQSSGCNTHPTPQQFIVTVNCLAFNNLARSVSKGNCEPGVLRALLGPDACQQGSPAQEHQLADKCLDAGNIDAAAELLLKTTEHSSCAVASSDSRLIFYIAGYVARRCILKMKCENCLRVLLMSKEKSSVLNLAEFVRLKD